MASKGDIKAGGVYVEVMARMGKLMSGLATARKSVREFSQSVMDAGKAVAGIGLAAGAPMGLAVKTFADFDDQMRKVAAFSGEGTAGMAKMTEAAKRLGATTSFTAAEVANVMAELAKSGIVADQMEAVTRSVMNLARATDTDVVNAAEGMNQVFAQFGLEASANAERVADAMTLTANKTLASVDSLIEAMSELGPIASQTGASFEDTMALAGILSNVGIQGSAAGTALKRMFTMSGAEAKKLGEIFGVNFLDASGNIRPLVDSMGEVGNAVKDLPSGERMKKFNDAFGLLSITVGSTVAASVGDIRQLREELNAVPGTAANAAKAMDAGLGGAFRIAASAVEGLAIAIGEAAGEELMDWVKGFQLAAAEAAEWITANKETVVMVGQIAAGFVAAGSAIAAFGAAGIVLSSILGGLSTMLGVIVGTISAVVSALGFLVSPIGLIVAGVAALIYFSGAGSAAASAISDAFASVYETVMPILGDILDALKSGEWGRAADIAMAALKLAWQSTLEWFTGAVGDTVTTTVGQILNGDWAGAWETVTLAMKVEAAKLVDFIVRTFTTAAREILQLFEHITGISTRGLRAGLRKLREDSAKGIRDAELNLKIGVDKAGITRSIKESTEQARTELAAARSKTAAKILADPFKYEGERKPGDKPKPPPPAPPALGGATVVLSSAAALAMSAGANSPEARARQEMLKKQEEAIKVAKKTVEAVQDVVGAIKDLAKAHPLLFGGLGT